MCFKKMKVFCCLDMITKLEANGQASTNNFNCGPIIKRRVEYKTLFATIKHLKMKGEENFSWNGDH